MSEKLGDVADALTAIRANKLDIKLLHDEVMKIHGYSEDLLDCVFDHLSQNVMLGKAFLAKGHRMRLKSIEKLKQEFGDK